MFVPYCTIGSDIEVTHTPLDKYGRTTVHIEIPDYNYGFRTANCTLPSYEISDVHYMSDKDILDFKEFCRHNAHLLLEYARIGGVQNA